MTTTTLTITHPDGTVSKRGTAREYKFGIVLTPREPQTWRTFIVKTLDARIALLADLDKRIEAGVIHPAHARNTGSLNLGPYMSHTAHFSMPQASTLTVWCNAEGMTQDYRGLRCEIRPVADVLLDQARGTAKLWTEMNDADRLLIEAIDNGTADRGGYRVVRWSTKHQLAVRAVVEFDGCRELGHDVVIQAID